MEFFFSWPNLSVSSEENCGMLLKLGVFQLRKWSSNEVSLLSNHTWHHIHLRKIIFFFLFLWLLKLSTLKLDPIYPPKHFSQLHFHFKCPKAPSFGGLWESLNKMLKSHLFRIIDHIFSSEKLHTILIQMIYKF